MIEVESCNPWSVDCFVARKEFSSFGASLVDDCKDAVVFVAFRQVRDEVHRNVLEGSFVNVSVEFLKWGSLLGDVGL